MTDAVRLRLAGPAELPGALAEALAGGPPVAPLPPDPVARDRAVAALAPDEPVTEPDAAAVVVTSGSTGDPKAVVLTRAALRAAAEAAHERLGGPGDWVLALPTQYVAGLMVLVRALVAGTTVQTAGSDLADLPDLVRPGAAADLGPRRYLSLVPTQLARACRQPAVAAALAGFDAVLLGGAAADPALLGRARDLGIRVTTTYGMSETCGGVVYDGAPLPGVTVTVDDDARIRLGGPTLFAGYRLRPDLTAAALDDRGRLRTADRGEWRAGRLLVLGRTDDVVVTGGLKVDLAEVERALRGWPGWRDAEVAVLGVPDPEWGTRVVAVSDTPASLPAVRDHLRRVVPPYAAPQAVHHLPSLPRTSSGKVDRQALLALLGGTP